MAWSEWHPMDSKKINSVSENSGVYQLYSGTETLYFGQTDNLQRRLGEHLNSKNSCIQKATLFCYQITNDPEVLEKKILTNYKVKFGHLPPCNELL